MCYRLLWLVLLAKLCNAATLVDLTSAASKYKTPHCDSDKQGQVIVQLFAWNWTDVARECEEHLNLAGYCAVQVSPPNEHRVMPGRPWWERYQPVSYKLDSASGNRQQFIDMVNRCNAVGVKVYVDAVFNNMVAADAGVGQGTAGSNYNSVNLTFDGVPYSSSDFNSHCPTQSGNIEDFDDIKELRNCALNSLLDLDIGQDYVMGKITDYLNDMLAIGVDGYYIDAAKHMWPGDLRSLVDQTNRTNSGQAPFVYQEVQSLSDSDSVLATDYEDIGRVTEFKYGAQIKNIFNSDKIALTYVRHLGRPWGLLKTEDAVVFVDYQNEHKTHGSRSDVIKPDNQRAYKMATTFTLSWPYGVVRVMSSFRPEASPPLLSAHANDGCGNEWVCEHRWSQISNMVAWRNMAGAQEVENWWTNGNNQIAFSRGNKSFIAFNRDDGFMDVQLTTGLPAGHYCDIISGHVNNGRCSGETITVDEESKAQIRIDGYKEHPYIAFHLGSKISSPASTTTFPTSTYFPSLPPTRALPTTPPISQLHQNNFKRTIVFIKKFTQPGENVFLRGGYGSPARPIPITYVHQRSHSNFQAYRHWSVNDNYLDWNGPEPGQGEFNGHKAEGSPMVWTSNDSNDPSYVLENIYDGHVWMWEVLMDCSALNGGYFELKGFFKGNFERDVAKRKCQGDHSTPNFPSNNHIAKCGYKNLFEWDNNWCLVEEINQ